MLIHLGKRYLGQRDVPNPNPDADVLEMSDNDDQKLDLRQGVTENLICPRPAQD